jgi:hypothetical protein
MLDTCCWAEIACVAPGSAAAYLERTIGCNDACPVTCGERELEHCLLDPSCEIFDPGACGPAPPGVVEGPACIGRHFGSCDGNAPCLPPRRCVPFWVNPCAGLPCLACGAVQHFCVE